MIELRARWRTCLWIGVYALPTSFLAALVWGGGRGWLLATAVAGGYAALCRGWRRRTIVVDERGVTWRGWFGSVEKLPWHEVASSRYATGMFKRRWWESGILEAMIDRLLAFAVRRTRVRVSLVRHDGRRHAIDGDEYELAPVLDEVMAHVHRHVGERFAPFAFETDGLATPGGRAPWLAIDAVRVALHLTIAVSERAKGGLALLPGDDEWCRVPIADIENGALLVQRLAERSLVIEVDADATLPPSLLREIEAGRARRAAMPSAAVGK